MKRLTLREAVIATLSYRAIFSYPLTREELWLWGIGGWIPRLGKITIQGVQESDGYFVLSQGHTKLSDRTNREQIAKAKKAIALQASKILAVIPTVEFVGLTGAVAAQNAPEDDDIDFYIVTSKNALWFTRFCAIMVLSFFGMRRKYGQLQVKDAICLNVFVTIDALPIAKSVHSLYLAHEVLLLVPLFDRGGVYKQFIQANSWVKHYLPNKWDHVIKNLSGPQKSIAKFGVTLMLFILQLFLEKFCRNIQLRYMKKHRSNETILPYQLFFHPHDGKIWVREKYKKILQVYGIPLDKVWYTSVK